MSEFQTVSASELSSIEGGFHIGFDIPFTGYRFDLYIDDQIDVCVTEGGNGTCQVTIPLK